MIIVKWPNVDPVKARFMKKKLNKTTFKKTPLRIMAHGGMFYKTRA